MAFDSFEQLWGASHESSAGRPYHQRRPNPAQVSHADAVHRARERHLWEWQEELGPFAAIALLAFVAGELMADGRG